MFDPENFKGYSLKALKDLAGVRVLAFPSRRLMEIDVALRKPFEGWKPDPVLSEEGEELAFKYWGYSPVGQNVIGEYQIVPMLTGLFWEVEHSAIYKPAPELRGVVRSLEMREPIANVHKALRQFEDRFEALVQHVPE
jgi:hypothetical protein